MQSTTSVLKICIVINDEKSLKSAYFFENGPQPLEKVSGFQWLIPKPPLTKLA